MCVCVCVCVCLSLSLSLCLSVSQSLFMSLSVCLFLSVSLCLSVSVSLFLSLSFSLFLFLLKSGVGQTALPPARSPAFLVSSLPVLTTRLRWRVIVRCIQSSITVFSHDQTHSNTAPSLQYMQIHPPKTARGCPCDRVIKTETHAILSPCGMHLSMFNSVQFSSRWYLCAQKSTYVLHPFSEKFLQC